MVRIPGNGLTGRLAALAALVVAAAVLLLVLSVVHLLPRLRNPFAETATVRNGPVVLKSITALSRYEAASGSYQVVVDLTRKTSFLPSFLAGSQTLFIGDGTDIAYVDFSRLRGPAIQVSQKRSSVTITLPPPRLEPAVLNVRQSYVFAEQQGLVDRLNSFFGGNPNSQQAVYIDAQRQIQAAAQRGPLLGDARRNTSAMLTGMLSALGFQHVTVKYQR
ncbi:MAG TPA: DUF4230 domain-containing protein [Streptosporangiaceae bacterium]|nr:DUF4230 domain-containing protein [Streptosporangiaceae bacterium]